jgi:hypothetical protein
MKQNVHHRQSFWLGAMVVALSIVSGCSLPQPASPTAVPAQPMTLPRFLGLDVVAGHCRQAVYRSRVRLSHYVPVVAPHPPGSAPVAIGDPCNLQSPSPAVAVAAGMQQAEAAAPAKVQALRYLSQYRCAQHPEVEVAYLAGMDDISESVRAAAVESIIDSAKTCQGCTNECGGCCTPAIHEKLNKLAYERNEHGCYCEPSSNVRRLARLGLQSCCAQAYNANAISMPLEVPPTEILEQVQALPLNNF